MNSVRFHFFSIMVLCIALLAAPSCRNDKHAARQGRITVTDFRGKQVSFDKEPQRIVCLIESALSGIYMLGAEDRVVGVSSNIYEDTVSPFYAAMDARIADKKLPAPGNWDFVNLESVAALRPDLVLIWSHQEESIRAMEDLGIPVYGVFIQSMDDVYKEMRDLGVLTGRDARAQELIEYTQSELSVFSQSVGRLRPEHRTRVYFMWPQSNLDSAGGPSIVNDLIKRAGAQNVTGHIGQEHVVVNMENVLTWDPEVIIMWYNAQKNSAHVIGEPTWKSVSAVRSGRVHEFPSAYSCDLWTLKFQYALKMAAKWSYPQAFDGIDEDSTRENMYRVLYGDRDGLKVDE
jgi:iron complex transport system substrate-binding protein